MNLFLKNADLSIERTKGERKNNERSFTYFTTYYNRYSKICIQGNFGKYFGFEILKIIQIVNYKTHANYDKSQIQCCLVIKNHDYLEYVVSWKHL